jgi:hypothetical protein
MSSSQVPCAECCAAINKLYPRLYQLVRIASANIVDPNEKSAFLTNLIEIAKLSTGAIYQQLKCQKVLCCMELIEGLYEVFKIYINQATRNQDDLIAFINAILVPAGFPAITAPTNQVLIQQGTQILQQANLRLAPRSLQQGTQILQQAPGNLEQANQNLQQVLQLIQ